jgi:hypothetical protein
MVTHVTSGEEALPFVNPRYAPVVYTAMAATGLAAAALFAPIEAISIVGMTVLTGVGYGIANDMIACRDCIQYFTVGHFFDGDRLEHRPINTLDPNANAVIWGMIATWHVCAIAGVFFAALARAPICSLASAVSTAQLAPYLIGGAVITGVISHVFSRYARGSMEKIIENSSSDDHFFYDAPVEYMPGFAACNVRNLTGYVFLGIGSTILSAAIVAARVGIIGL